MVECAYTLHVERLYTTQWNPFDTAHIPVVFRSSVKHALTSSSQRTQTRQPDIHTGPHLHYLIGLLHDCLRTAVDHSLYVYVKSAASPGAPDWSLSLPRGMGDKVKQGKRRQE